MKLGVGNLMDGGRDRLYLAHALPDGDILLVLAEVAIGAVTHGFQGYGNRRGSLEGFHKDVVLLHVSGQGTGQLGKGLSVRLGDIKD